MKTVICMIMNSLLTSSLSAGIIFESGTLGQVDIPRINVSAQEVLGLSVNEGVFSGVRFELTELVRTSKVGGHFVGPFGDENTFFGAIVSLTDANDFPDSRDLSTNDVLANTMLTFPESSAEVRGDLRLTLQPGWYALVFGSGLFGASGRGAAVRNNLDINNPSYIISQQVIPGDGWINLEVFPIEPEGNLRFVVEGAIIPEPSTQILLGMTLSIVSLLLRK